MSTDDEWFSGMRMTVKLEQRWWVEWLYGQCEVGRENEWDDCGCDHWMNRDDELVNWITLWSVWMSREAEWDDCDQCEWAVEWMGWLWLVLLSREDECVISVNEQRGRMWWMCDQCECAERKNGMTVGVITVNGQRGWMGYFGYDQWMSRDKERDDCVIRECEWAEKMNGMTARYRYRGILLANAWIL